ncbi:uncharacterized protein LOC110981596 isoform X2 [Acanthaster planci]|uniref:Rho GTPase-activating protein 39 n=1 Tax=Acanthaster planci TaxID=133434 RepID=A0A8B7YUF0_ACAPL|nr:uncharacterized protein LOC110981596 isoform X2 [Acanthaster planci]
MTERVEWVEIIEPKTQRPMYGNLRTGELAWEPPSNAKVKKRDNNQWWELFDPKTKRFYYYNEMLEKTVWHRPLNCDIIPLAKLQTLKLNTEVRPDDGDWAKQRQQSSQRHRHRRSREHHNRDRRTGSERDNATNTASEGLLEDHTRAESANGTGPRFHKRMDSLDERHIHGSPVENRRKPTQAATVPPPGVSHGSPQSRRAYRYPLDQQQQALSYQQQQQQQHQHQQQQASFDQLRRLRSDSEPVEPSPHALVGVEKRRRSSTDNSRMHHHPGFERQNSGRGDALRGVDLLRSSGRSFERDGSPPMGYQQRGSPRYQDGVGVNSSSQGDMYRDGFGGGSPQFGMPYGQGYPPHPQNRHYQHERSDSQLSISSQHSVGGGVSGGGSADHQHHHHQEEGSPVRTVQDDIRKPVPSPRLKKKSKMPRMGLGAVQHHAQPPPHPSPTSAHGHAPHHPQQQHSIPGIPHSQSGERFQQFQQSPPLQHGQFQPQLPPPPPVSDYRSGTPTSATTAFTFPQHLGHYPYDRQDSFEGSPTTVPVTYHYNVQTPDSSASQDSFTPLESSDLPHHYPTKAEFRSNLHKHSESQLSQTSQHSLSSQHSDSSLRQITSDSQSSDDVLRSSTPPQQPKPDNHLVHSVQQQQQQQAPPQSEDSTSQHVFPKASQVQKFKPKQKPRRIIEDGPNPIYENLDFIHQKQREDHQRVRLRELDQIHYATLEPPQVPPRQRRPLSGMPPAMSIIPNGDSEVIEEGQLDLRDDGSQENLNKSFDSDENDDEVKVSQEALVSEDLGSVAEDGTLNDGTVPNEDQEDDEDEQGETVHESLRRTRKQQQQDNGSMAPCLLPTLERSISVQDQRPSSLQKHGTVPGAIKPSPSLITMGRSKKPSSSESDLENYAAENVNRHKKGILRRKIPLAQMLSFTKDPIRKPMLLTRDKVVKKEAVDVFKLIQCYMGDRALKNLTHESVSLDLVRRGWTVEGLRDEMYIQVCRQTTANYVDDSLRRGWELMAIFLNFFPPSIRFFSYLEGYIYKHLTGDFDTRQVPVRQYADHCYKKLERIAQTGARKGVKKITLEEINLAKDSVFHPSLFGNTLDEVMELQKERFPDRKLPWIAVVLAEEVLRLEGEKVEGIFRVPGDIDEVNALKVKCDQWIMPQCDDANIPASLLKLWYRDLYDPLIPMEFYERCVSCGENAEAALAIVQELPDLNRLVLCHFIKFLQIFSQEENVSRTKMDINNLAMVMAPNCLRCASDNPQIIFENTRKEMSFIRLLITNLDTIFMAGVI